MNCGSSIGKARRICIYDVKLLHATATSKKNRDNILVYYVSNAVALDLSQPRTIIIATSDRYKSSKLRTYIRKSQFEEVLRNCET